MFGYVRPLQPEIRIKDLALYRAVYCGLCKTLGQTYGAAARLSLSYDLTFLAALLSSFASETPDLRPSRCMLSPLGRKPTLRPSPILQSCATLSVLLSYQRAVDDQKDGRYWRGKAVALSFGPAYRRAKRKEPQLHGLIERHLAVLARMEQGRPDPAACEPFAALLQELFQSLAQRHVAATFANKALAAGIGRLGGDLGRWIYLIDAIDDLDGDVDHGRWNPLGGLNRQAARDFAKDRLEQLELCLDQTAALLPYQQGSGLIENIVTRGLPDVRRQVLAGQPLRKGLAAGRKDWPHESRSS